MKKHDPVWTSKEARDATNLALAAPDLLKALMNLTASCEKLRAFNKPDNILSIARLEAARAAIAKAKGGES